MMIYGVSYHVVPRFVGHPLHSPKLAGAHWWLSNIGLSLMIVGFALAPHFWQISTYVLGSGGILSALGAFSFIFNLWQTMDGPKALRPGLSSRCGELRQL